MVQGCFWHRHDCHLFRWPSSRPEFWAAKIEANRVRDEAVKAKLLAEGWRILVLWECATKGRERRSPDDVVSEVAAWLDSTMTVREIRGVQGGAG